MTFRVWAGFWVFLAAIITVMFEGSFLIRYFTRFTEDIFASLVALIFIVESLKFVYKVIAYQFLLCLEVPEFFCLSEFRLPSSHKNGVLLWLLPKAWPPGHYRNQRYKLARIRQFHSSDIVHKR